MEQGPRRSHSLLRVAAPWASRGDPSLTPSSRLDPTAAPQIRDTGGVTCCVGKFSPEPQRRCSRAPWPSALRQSPTPVVAGAVAEVVAVTEAAVVVDSVAAPDSAAVVDSVAAAVQAADSAAERL